MTARKKTARKASVRPPKGVTKEDVPEGLPDPEDKVALWRYLERLPRLPELAAVRFFGSGMAANLARILYEGTASDAIETASAIEKLAKNRETPRTVPSTTEISNLPAVIPDNIPEQQFSLWGEFEKSFQEKVFSTRLPRKKELFCRYYILWNDRIRAVNQAGWNWGEGQPARTAASKHAYDLLRQPTVQARLGELEQIFNAVHIFREYAGSQGLRNLAMISQVSLGDYMDDKGNLSFKRLREDGIPIKSVRHTKEGPHVALYDSQRAAEFLAQAAGLAQPPKEETQRTINIVLGQEVSGF